MRTRDRVKQQIVTIADVTEQSIQPAVADPTPQELTELFLANVTPRYIEQLKRAYKNPVAGGDLEIAEIAEVLGLRVVVHRMLGHSLNAGPQFAEQLAVGPADAEVVHLVQVDKHYHIFIPASDTNAAQIIKLPAEVNGNELFHACIRAKKLANEHFAR